MLIGELGRCTGVSARALRHYEELGLQLAEVDAYLARLHEVRTELDAQLRAALFACALEPRCALDLPEGSR